VVVPFTVSVRVVLWVAEGAVPVIVIGYVPGWVFAVVVMVSVEKPPAEAEAGANAAVLLLGRPVALNATVSAVPDVIEVLTVTPTEPAAPPVTVADAGLTLSVKSLPTDTDGSR
jgi:hypothetical protein